MMGNHGKGSRRTKAEETDWGLRTGGQICFDQPLLPITVIATVQIIGIFNADIQVITHLPK